MKKNKLILLQIVIAFMLICTSVYAATTTIVVTPSKTAIERGEVFSIILSLKDIETNETIRSVEGYINYNKDIIEPITVDSIEKTSENTVKIGNETLPVEDVTNKSVDEISLSDAYVVFNGSPQSSNNQVKILIDFKNGITADTDLLKINFKVKSTATLGEVENAISYSQFTINGNDSSTITKNIKITVKAVETNNDNNNTINNNNVNNNTNTNNVKNNSNTNSNIINNNTNTNNTNQNTNKTNTNNTTNKSSNNTNKVNNTTNKVNNNSTKDNTVSGKKLPATGAKAIIIPVILVMVLAYVSYNKYIKYKDI